MHVRAIGLLSVLSFAAACDDSPAATPARDSGADAPAVTDAPALADTPAADAPAADALTYNPAELLAPGEVTFPASGPRSGAMGRGHFSFGVATASAQTEDMNTNTDWWAWTLPTAMGGLGHGRAPVGDGVQGYTQALTDIDLAHDLGVDVYRMSVEWARIEPRRNVIDMEALAHYGRVIDAVRARGMRVSLTVHHFSSPVWVDDPHRRTDCTAPSDTDLCGWDHPTGGPMIVAELAQHAALLARTFGDRVDEWATVNEPVNYLLASYGQDQFPPGRNLLLAQTDRFVDAVRNYVRAHAAIYDAIKANDTVDADGDGSPCEVGMTLSVAEWMPTRQRDVSTNPDDIAARDRVKYVYHYLFVDAVRNGTFDPDLSGTPSEMHPEWRNHLDWLGLQYYFRAGVSALPAVIPRVRANVCLPMLDLGACVVPADLTHYVAIMGYEFFEPGIFNILRDFSMRYPTLPFTVTEGGIAAETGARRAENVVRSLEQIERARRMGVDVRGYYHWSLLDNFEWAYGYVPRFGLYRVDRTSSPYHRTATEGATVYGAIAHARRITPEQRARYGGLGPMTPEITP